jgi:hypothetical protein
MQTHDILDPFGAEPIVAAHDSDPPIVVTGG